MFKLVHLFKIFVMSVFSNESMERGFILFNM